jgi:MFS family permease
MSKSFLYVLISTFLLVLGTYISGTILTPYAQDMGATWFQIGILSGSMYVIRLIFGTPIGRLADRRGALAVLKYSLMLYPIIAAAYFFAGNIYLLTCARLLHGMASAMMLPMGMAYVGHISPDGKEGKYMSIYNLTVILASGIGPMLSTMIAGFFDYKATFLVLFLLAILALMVIRLSHEGNKTVGIKRPEREEISRKEARISRKAAEINRKAVEIDRKAAELSQGGMTGKYKRLAALGFANIALAVVTSLVGFFFVPFLEDRGLALKYTGSYIAVYYFVSGIIQLPLGKFLDRHNKYTAALVSGFGTAAALSIFLFTDHIFVLCFGMILTALASASFLTAVSSLSVFVGRELGMGNTMGLLNSINSAGMIFACVLLGLLPGSGNNYELFFYFSGIAMTVSTVLFSILWPKGMRQRKPH